MSNCFGRFLRHISFGESHGKAVGVVVDGCPSGIALDFQEFKLALEKRAPGRSPYTSPRKEEDIPEILSGIFEGKTTGAPIAIVVYNKDICSKPYEEMQSIYRPGHANFTYEKKYGHFDYRGSGRASARETIARVLAAVIAKKILAPLNLEIDVTIDKLGDVECQKGEESSLLSHAMVLALEKAIAEKDSLGAVLKCTVRGLPAGLGSPVYAKLPALLGSAMLSIPAVKGFEMGEGFDAAKMKGSDHNDAFMRTEEGKIECKTNHAGGVLGGISTGAPLVMRIAFKPTSTIGKMQESVDTKGNSVNFSAGKGGRHDPCVAIRAIAVVEAMAYLVLADVYLLEKK
jgi:chorismate synthase